MTLVEFFNIHWFLALITILFIGKCAVEIITLCKLPFRSFMVAKNGWPPEYMDADGDNHHKVAAGNRKAV